MQLWSGCACVYKATMWHESSNVHALVKQRQHLHGNLSDNCIYKQVWTILRFGENTGKTKGIIKYEETNIYRLLAEEKRLQRSHFTNRWVEHVERAFSDAAISRELSDISKHVNYTPTSTHIFIECIRDIIQYLNKITRTRSPVKGRWHILRCYSW